mmetsp:Transcript_11073/g.28454  ORF Transcript_11073/g.28454 Transcript_11073/m.28454 type:complete len:281 (+) Transcript_11073:1169-2011(+)
MFCEHLRTRCIGLESHFSHFPAVVDDLQNLRLSVVHAARHANVDSINLVAACSVDSHGLLHCVAHDEPLHASFDHLQRFFEHCALLLPLHGVNPGPDDGLLGIEEPQGLPLARAFDPAASLPVHAVQPVAHVRGVQPTVRKHRGPNDDHEGVWCHEALRDGPPRPHQRISRPLHRIFGRLARRHGPARRLLVRPSRHVPKVPVHVHHVVVTQQDVQGPAGPLRLRLEFLQQLEDGHLLVPPVEDVPHLDCHGLAADPVQRLRVDQPRERQRPPRFAQITM